MSKLLIVDDEEDVREFASNFFRKRKINVLTAANGNEALSLIKEQKPDLVLLDIKMPGIDGIEVLRSLRKNKEDTRVIMVTGKKPEDEESFQQCQEFGILGYIHKPLELDELEKIVLKELS